MTPTDENQDTDLRKGAVEQEDPKKKGQTSLNGQLGHRDQDAMLKDNDTDFPEPGENEEHSGLASDGINLRRGESEGTPNDQEPGHRQKQSQDKKDDPLAA